MIRLGASVVVAISIAGCSAQSKHSAYVGTRLPAETSAALAEVKADVDQANKFCASFVARQIAPQSFGQAVSPIAKISPKNEFETTEQFNARVAAVTSQGAESLVIGKAIKDYSYLAYDADRQKLIVSAYAFDNQNFDPWRIFQAAKVKEPVASTMSNIDVFIGETDKTVGSYIGTNAFGVSMRVRKVQRSTNAIFQRSSTGISAPIFVDQDSKGVIGEIAMSPDVARTLKPKLKIAFVVKPKAPFLVRANYSGGEPTIDDPEDVEVSATVLIADIQCGLVLDHKSEVLASYVAQGARRIQPPLSAFERRYREAMGL